MNFLLISEVLNKRRVVVADHSSLASYPKHRLFMIRLWIGALSDMDYSQSYCDWVFSLLCCLKYYMFFRRTFGRVVLRIIHMLIPAIKINTHHMRQSCTSRFHKKNFSDIFFLSFVKFCLIFAWACLTSINLRAISFSCNLKSNVQ